MELRRCEILQAAGFIPMNAFLEICRHNALERLVSEQISGKPIQC